MRNLVTIAVCALAISASQHARADFYDFRVLYNGSGDAVLDSGSDNPDGLALVDGDSFAWNIKAQGDDAWTVVTGGDFFPLMAFGVQESGERTGDFTLTLRNNGVDVFTTSESAAINNFVHLGTNTIALATGLVFDEMHLDYLLITALEDVNNALDPNDLQPINSTISGLLPIFGAPEMNPFSPGITYGVASVPEPASMAMMASGMLVLAAVRHRRAKGSARSV